MVFGPLADTGEGKQKREKSFKRVINVITVTSITS
jgi:hypothetical protein